MNKWPQHLKWSGLGIYDLSIGAKISMSCCNDQNKEVMKDILLIKTGIDAEYSPYPKTALGWLSTIVAPLEDYKGTEEYC